MRRAKSAMALQRRMALRVQSCGRMRVVVWLRVAAGVAAIIVAVLLFRYAVAVSPDYSDHHGSAVDGLDGLGTLVALVSGAGGLLSLVLGLVLLRRPGRRAGARRAP